MTSRKDTIQGFTGLFDPRPEPVGVYIHLGFSRTSEKVCLGIVPVLTGRRLSGPEEGSVLTVTVHTKMPKCDVNVSPPAFGPIVPADVLEGRPDASRSPGPSEEGRGLPPCRVVRPRDGCCSVWGRAESGPERVGQSVQPPIGGPLSSWSANTRLVSLGAECLRSPD